jgi:hypothetical protein
MTYCPYKARKTGPKVTDKPAVKHDITVEKISHKDLQETLKKQRIPGVGITSYAPYISDKYLIKDVQDYKPKKRRKKSKEV